MVVPAPEEDGLGPADPGRSGPGARVLGAASGSGQEAEHLAGRAVCRGGRAGRWPPGTGPDSPRAGRRRAAGRLDRIAGLEAATVSVAPRLPRGRGCGPAAAGRPVSLQRHGHDAHGRRPARADGGPVRAHGPGALETAVRREVVVVESDGRIADPRGEEFGWMENIGADAVWEAWPGLPGNRTRP